MMSVMAYLQMKGLPGGSEIKSIGHSMWVNWAATGKSGNLEFPKRNDTGKPK